MSEKNTIKCYPEMRFGCQRCGLCCAKCEITLTSEEVSNISRLMLSGDKQIESQYFEPIKGNIYRILKNEHGQCLFCDKDTLCMIHRKFGVSGKPMACRIYPMNVLRWEDGIISADLRFSCPAVGIETGDSLARNEKTIRQEALQFKARRLETAAYSRQNPTALSTVRIVHQAFSEILHNHKYPLRLRLYTIARIIKFHESPPMRKAIAGADEKFIEDAVNFFDKAHASLESELNNGKMNWRLKLDFLTLLCGYMRNDERNVKITLLERLKKAGRNVAFGFGFNTMNSINKEFPVISGKECLDNSTAGNFTPAAIEGFEQFFYGKLDAMHFCGQHVHDYSYQQGMRHLLLSVPIITTVARAFAFNAGKDEVDFEHLRRGLSIIEPAFSLSPFFKLAVSRNLINHLAAPDAYAAILNSTVIFKE